MPTTAGSRAAPYRVLRRLGMSARSIARRRGVSDKTVTKPLLRFATYRPRAVSDHGRYRTYRSRTRLNLVVGLFRKVRRTAASSIFHRLWTQVGEERPRRELTL